VGKGQNPQGREKGKGEGEKAGFIPFAPCPLPFALCPLPLALYPLPFALCPLPFTPCPLPLALCPSPASLEIADTEERESRICRTQLLQKSVKV